MRICPGVLIPVNGFGLVLGERRIATWRSTHSIGRIIGAQLLRGAAP